MYRITDPDRRMADFIMAIAESGTLEELGATCHRAASCLVDAPVLGLYLIRQRAPNLAFSYNAPRGFLNEYEAELAPCDPMIEMITEERRAVSGSMLRSSKRWNVHVMEQLLKRWGFCGNMCGPILVDSRIAGLVYTADREETAADNDRPQRMDFICRSASIALGRILAAQAAATAGGAPGSGRIAPARLPPRLAEVAMLVCRGLTNKEIARMMTISHHTVKEHITNLCLRFDVQNRTELAATMIRVSKDSAPAESNDIRYAALHDAIFRPSFKDTRICAEFF